MDSVNTTDYSSVFGCKDQLKIMEIFRFLMGLGCRDEREKIIKIASSSFTEHEQ